MILNKSLKNYEWDMIHIVGKCVLVTMCVSDWRLILKWKKKVGASNNATVWYPDNWNAFSNTSIRLHSHVKELKVY